MVFSWFVGRSRNRAQSGLNQPPPLFGDDAYIVVPTELLPQGENREELEHSGNLTLASNMHEQSQWSIYYEILYIKVAPEKSSGNQSSKSEKRVSGTTADSSSPQTPFSFLIYHSRSKRDAAEMFSSANLVLTDLEHWLPLNRELAGEHLRSVMLSLKLNRAWTAAHIAARLGGTFDGFFDLTEAGSQSEPRGNQSGHQNYLNRSCSRPKRAPLAPAVINCQVPPDLYTPLHLAIKECHLDTVRLILEHHSPNLDLLNNRQHSVLHYAAVSTPQIAQLLLSQPGTRSRLSLVDNTGCTALHLACYAQKFDTLFVFLAHGLTVRQLTLSPPGSRPKIGKKQPQPLPLPSDADPAQAKVVHLSEQDFEDLDCSDVYAGGTPLHWTKTKRLLEKLIANYRFPLNGRNSNGDTALHVASRRLRMKVVITLLCAGANVNATNIFGNTPLHLAVRENDLVVPQTLIVFDANIDARNFSNESVRHVAAKCAAQSESLGASASSNEAILYLLSALGAKRCPQATVAAAAPSTTNEEKETSKSSTKSLSEPSKNESGKEAKISSKSRSKTSTSSISSKNACSIGCSFNGDFEGKIAERLFGVDQKYDHIFKDFLFGDAVRQNLAEAKYRANSENNIGSSNIKPVNMLCLDGGGIKGLISVQLLCELERHLKHPLNAYFSWFAGTSTGSFIAAFLATGMSLKAIRAHYFRLKDRVLTPEHGRPYSSEAIEVVLQEIIGDQLTMEQLLTVHGKHVLVPTAVANRRPMKLHLFRSYPSPSEMFAEAGRADLGDQLLPDRDDDLNHQTITATTLATSSTATTGHHHQQQYPSRRMEVWKALRASGAAPGYFRAFNDFLDGGLLANNPTIDALCEFQTYNAALKALSEETSGGQERPSSPSPLSISQFQQHRLTAVVSVGTGRGLLEPTDVLDITGNYSTLRQIKQILLLLIYEVTQTEQHVNGRAEAFAQGIGAPFYRLNAFLSEMIDLDEQQEYRLINCLWETKRFMYYRREEVKALATYLEAVTVGLPKEEKDKVTKDRERLRKQPVKNDKI